MSCVSLLVSATQLKIGIDVGENDAEPRQFLECAVQAEESGFDSFWFGDHFMPWTHTDGKSAFVWSLLGSSLERTKRIAMGPNVTCPIGGRYHPAVVAQAAATLDNMYPGRLMLGVGSGEAVNEARFFQGGVWPPWKERIERLAEAVRLIRDLWASEDYFTFNGKFFRMTNVLLYTRPKSRIPIYFSASGSKAAIYAGRFGDHLVTTASAGRCQSVIFPNFEKGIRMSRRKMEQVEKMVCIYFMIGEPELSVRKLKAGPAGNMAKGSIDELDPRRVEASAATIEEARIRERFPLCPSVNDLIPVVKTYIGAGANHIVLGTGPSPDLIKSIGEKVLPFFR
jgi:coenzyme F420-dependent glucose-6-phosphate dehydrogenase